VQSRIWRGGVLNEILRSPYLRDRYVFERTAVYEDEILSEFRVLMGLLAFRCS